MIEKLKSDPYKNYTRQTWYNHKKAVEYLMGKIEPNSIILDIGQRSPFTELLDRVFKSSTIYNTAGDLDEDFYFPEHNYNYIIYSHTIEHQFCPLNTLNRLHSLNAKIFIFLPNRPKFLWIKDHFHEIDNYRMQLLVERANYKILSFNKLKTRRPFLNYFKGVRPILRFFFEHIAVYEIKVKQI